jgi:hypothetical protein
MESEREAEIETERRTQVKFSARSKMNKTKTDAMRRDAKKLELRFFFLLRGGGNVVGRCLFGRLLMFFPSLFRLSCNLNLQG